MCLRSDFLFYINPMKNGEYVPYTYFADEATITLNTEFGKIEIVLTDAEQIRFRGEGIDMEIETSPAIPNIGCGRCSGAYFRKDGSIESTFGMHGHLLFNSLKGDLSFVSEWDKENLRYSKMNFRIAATDGKFELAVHEDKKEITIPAIYDSFDNLVEKSRSSFNEFCKNYADTCPDEYKEMAHIAKWIIWTHRTKAIDNFVEPGIFMHYQWLIATFAWQQSYNGMAMEGNPAEGWRQICTTFNYQDRYGRLPAMVSHTSMGPGLQPPFQGFAFDFLTHCCGYDFLTYEEAVKMYPKFKKWLEFWLVRRNAGLGDDTIIAFDPNETGWDDSSMFRDGFPVTTPCLMSFLALYMEMMSVVAAKCGFSEEAADWKKRSEKVIHDIIERHWDGEKFLSIHDGKQVDTLSLTDYLPLMLGARLPDEIIDKCIEKLSVEDSFLTPIGLASENVMTEYCNWGPTTFVHGRVAAPQNMIICAGLYRAGRYEAAQFFAKRYCDYINKVGPILDLAPYECYPYSGEKAEVATGPTAAGSWSWNTWCSANFLILVNRILGNPSDTPIK